MTLKDSFKYITNNISIRYVVPIGVVMKGFKIKELVPRGFLYPHILMILKKKPMNGYLLIRKIKEITGFWIPSTGSIYPALDYLKRNGFIKIMKKTKKSTIYMLSEKGKAAASEFEHTGNEMKEKITDTFSKVLNINKERLGIVMEQLKKDYTKKQLV